MYVYIERYIFHARIHRHRPIGGDRSIKSRISRRSLSDASGLDIQSVGGGRRGNIFIARRKRCPEVCCDAAHGQRRHARPLIDIKLAGKWPVIRNNERQSVFRVILLDHRERIPRDVCPTLLLGEKGWPGRRRAHGAVERSREGR